MFFDVLEIKNGLLAQQVERPVEARIAQVRFLESPPKSSLTYWIKIKNSLEALN